MTDLKRKIVCVTGGKGFLGQNIIKALRRRGFNLIAAPRSKDYDLRTKDGIDRLLENVEPQIIIHAAAHSGGIGLNQQKPGELFYDNAIMGIQLMHEAYKAGVEKFVQIGTVCEYPKFALTPFWESELWDGYPEETNAPYGIAKKSLLVMGQAYRKQYGFNAIHLLPVNLYGPGDNFYPGTSHVIPALIQKFSNAKFHREKEVVIWGDGTAGREFLYVEDCAEAIARATEFYDKPEPMNIGSGVEIRIKDLAELIAKLVEYKGRIVYDDSKPNGQPRRCLDTSKAMQWLGFKANTELESGLVRTILWYYRSILGFNP